MRYRLGRHRRRNLYAQHGPEPSDDDVFVALFDDEHMAKRVCWLLNSGESLRATLGMNWTEPRSTEEQARLLARARYQHGFAGTATTPRREDSAHGPLAPSDECTCGHPAWMHSGHTGYCADANPSDTCVRFERRCSSVPNGRWSEHRCTLVAGHPGAHRNRDRFEWSPS